MKFILRMRQDFFYILRVRSLSENMKKSCLTSEIDSIFNVKSIELSVYYIFFGFWTHCMQYVVGRHQSLLFSDCRNNTWDIFTVWK